MARTNYKKIYAIKMECERRIKKICPNIPASSGIYVFWRTDEANIRRAYCGQAVNLLSRCASHLTEYDHIALSLKKHGFYSEEKPHGWKLIYELCSKDELDNKEIATIKLLADDGFQMYNVTSGGQSKGKLVVGERKASKGYYDGLRQGRINLAKEISHIIDKHLIVSIKPEKQNNKISIKAFEKFNELLKVRNEQDEQSERT